MRGDPDPLSPPDRAASDDPARRGWNHLELVAEAERAAATLLTRSFPADRVAIWGDSLPEWVLFGDEAAVAA